MRTRRYRKRGGTNPDGPSPPSTTPDEPAPPSMIDRGAAILKNPVAAASEVTAKLGKKTRETADAIAGAFNDFTHLTPAQMYEKGQAAIEAKAVEVQAATDEIERKIKAKAGELSDKIKTTTTNIIEPKTQDIPAPPATSAQNGGRRRKSKRKRAKRRTRR